MWGGRGRTVSSVLILTGLVLLSLSGGSLPVTAQGRCGTVVASDLAAPRFLTIVDDGTLYISEAGNGGEDVLPTPPGDEAEGEPETRGLTGRVTRIGPTGTRSAVAVGLPSYGSGGFGGPAGLVAAGGALWLAVGGPEAATALVEPLSLEGAVVRIDPQTGAVSKVADVLAYEKANNPDPHLVESNLYGLALGTDGSLYVADAAGNSLYRVDPQSEQLNLVAVIPGLPLSREALPAGLLGPDEPLANPERGNLPESDPVPTAVAVGPDGSLYLGLLTGFPFTPGQAKILRVSPDGRLGDAVTGLTMIVSLAFGPDGMLYVSQITDRIEFTGPDEPPSISPGSVVRVLPNGRLEMVAEGLNLPSGIAFDRAGNLFVAVNSTVPPGAPSPVAPQGQVLRCEGVAVPAQPSVQPPSQPTRAPLQPPVQVPDRTG